MNMYMYSCSTLFQMMTHTTVTWFFICDKQIVKHTYTKTHTYTPIYTHKHTVTHTTHTHTQHTHTHIQIYIYIYHTVSHTTHTHIHTDIYIYHTVSHSTHTIQLIVYLILCTLLLNYFKILTYRTSSCRPEPETVLEPQRCSSSEISFYTNK